MNAKLLFACALSFTLAGCSTPIVLNKISDESSPKVVLKDSRAAAERVYRRDGVLTPVQYFGDEDFDSPPLRQFSLLVGQQLPPGKYDLEVTKFRVIDVFPGRLNTTTQAALAGGLLSLGYTTYFSGSSSTEDNVTCLVSASVGAQAIDASESIPYKVASSTAMLKNDPSFKRAINECLVRLADKVAAPMRTGAL